MSVSEGQVEKVQSGVTRGNKATEYELQAKEKRAKFEKSEGVRDKRREREEKRREEKRREQVQ